jgi:hypothetical protein
MNPLEVAFPGLATTPYRVTSPPTADYNCIAWAAGATDRWWWPDAANASYWPSGVPREESIPAFLMAFANLGFVPTTDTGYEVGFEKVVLMAKNGKPTHMCRQLPSGRWTSKLGRAEDIEHELHALTGATYGDVVHVLRRATTT